jgi:prepilin-type N-terminal cleavage/methylation domain-containing protein
MTHNRLRNPTSRGFSLAEVLVATALLSVILLALFGLVTAGVRRAYGGKKMTEATVLAQAVMERANVEQPQALLSAASTATTATRTWTLAGLNVTPAAETAGTTPTDERNAWRVLLQQSRLPSSTAFPATLTVTMNALPTTVVSPRTAAATFADAATVRVVVDVAWSEWGSRPRQVRLQTFNVRTTNP